MEIIRNFIEHVIGTSHLEVSTEEKKKENPQIFKNTQKSDNFSGKVIENPSVKQAEKSKYWEVLSNFFFWKTPKPEPTVEEIGRAFLAKNYNSALSMIKQFKKDDETIIKLLEDVQNKIKELNEGDQESDKFITSIKDDFEAIAAVREDHQLDPHQVLRIVFTVQECLSPPPTTYSLKKRLVSISKKARV